MSAIGVELEELRLAARGQATRIRLEALREAGRASLAAKALAGSPEGAKRSLLEALERAVERVGGQWEEEEADRGAEDLAAEIVTAEPRAGAEPGAELEPGSGDPAPADRVSVDIGPFKDFSQLVSFEDAANAIGATSEISIRRFSEGRAEVDVSLREPIDLLRELEERCDLEFEVRSRDEDGIVLDLGE